MIIVKKYKHSEIALNVDLIEKVKQSVDATVITMVNKNKYIVEETLEEVLDKVCLAKQKVQAGAFKIIEETVENED